MHPNVEETFFKLHCSLAFPFYLGWGMAHSDYAWVDLHGPQPLIVPDH